MAEPKDVWVADEEGEYHRADDIDTYVSGGARRQCSEVWHYDEDGVGHLVWQWNVAPLAPTGASLAFAWNGTDYTATLAWSTAAVDLDLDAAEVTWTVNGVDYVVTAGSLTSATRSVPAAATVSARVRLRDTGGLWSPVTNVAARTAPPGQVTGISTSQVALDVVRLNYTAPAGTSHVRLYRKVGSGAETTLSLSASATEFNDRIGAGATVQYQLQAVGSGGDGPTSSAVSRTASAPAPSNYRVPNVTASYSTVTTAWNAVPYATGYQVQSNGVTATTTSTSYPHGVSHDTTYQFRVRAYSTYLGVTAYGAWSSYITVEVGHPASSGWYAEQAYRPPSVTWTSSYASAGGVLRPSSNAIDSAGTSTAWVSGERSTSTISESYEGLTFAVGNPDSGQTRRWTRIGVYLLANHRMWVTQRTSSGSWQGSVDPGFSSYPYTELDHDYLGYVDGGPGWVWFDLPDSTNLANGEIQVALWGLKTLSGFKGYRAAIADVSLRYQRYWSISAKPNAIV